MRKIFNILILVFTLLLSANSANGGSVGSTSSGLYVAWNGYNATSVSGVISCANKITITLIAPYGINYWFSFIYDGVLISSSSAFTSNMSSTEIYDNGQYITEFNNLGYYGNAYPGIKINFNSSGTYTFNFVYENGNITLSDGEAICGPSEPLISDVTSSICIPVNLTSLEPTVTYDASCNSNSEWWELDGIEVTSGTIFSPGSKLRYCVKDNTNFETKTFYSNEIILKDKPVILIIADDKLCTTSGETYDISQHAINWNSDIGTASYTLNGDAVSSTISNVGTITVDATNTCGSAEQRTFALTSGCKPVVSTLQTPDAVCSGNALLFTAPTVTDATSIMWQIHLPGDADGVWHDNFDISVPLNFSSHNDAKVRYAATNENGTTYSNEVTLTIKSNAPDFTITKSAGVVVENYGEESRVVTYTINKTFECNNDDITFTLSNTHDFEEPVINENVISIKLKDGLAIGDYSSAFSISVGSETKNETVIGKVVEWPKVFPIKQMCISGEDTTTTTTYWTTDNEGVLCVITDTLSNCTYINEGDIAVDKFYFGSIKNDGNSANDGHDLSKLKFYNRGVIQADEISLGDFTYKNVTYGGVGGSPVCYVGFDCAGTYISNTFNMMSRNGLDTVKGVFSIDDRFFMTAQAVTSNENITVDECAVIRVDTLELNLPGGHMKFGVKGHVIADNVKINVPNIISYSGAIITIGGTDNDDLVIVLDENSILNLCFNPTKASVHELNQNSGYYVNNQQIPTPIDGADKIAICFGTLMYLYGETTGWNDEWTPETEGDINCPGNYNPFNSYVQANHALPKAKSSIPAYVSYQDCMNEDTHILMGMDDDPFINKDKEIKFNKLYCEPCDKELEHTKIQIRELGNKWFRYINGELIYCEGDN